MFLRRTIVTAVLVLLPFALLSGTVQGQVGLSRTTRPELVLQSGHVDRVAAVAVSRDGRLIASGGWDGYIKIWDARTGEVQRSIHAASELMPVAFMPDGRSIVGGSTGNTVRIWDIATGEVLRSYKGHTGLVLSAAVSPNGKILASSGEDGELRLWNIQEETLMASTPNPKLLVEALAFSPDGKTLAGSADNDIRIWNGATGRQIRELKGHTKLVSSLQYSPDGELLLSGSYDREARLWNAATGALRKTFTGSKEDIHAVSFSRDGKTIATGGGLFAEVGELRLWDASSGALKRELKGHTGFVSGLTYTPDNKTLVSSSWDQSVRLWDAATGQPKRTLHGLGAWMKQVAYSPDGRTIAAASHDNTVKLWDAATGTLKFTLTGHSDEVNSVAYSPDGKTLVSGGGDLVVKVWDAATGTLIRDIKGQDGAINCVAFSPDGSTIASAGWRDGIRLWDAKTGVFKELIKVSDGWINTVTFSPDGKLLAYGGGDQTVYLWNLAEHKVQNTLRTFSAEVSCLAFSPDGTMLATGNADKTLMLWFFEKDLIRTLSKGQDWSIAIDWSPDGKQLASAGMGDEVKVWDIASGDVKQRLKADFDWVWSVDFSNNGKTLMAGAFDNTIHFWDAGNGRLLTTLLPMPDVARAVGARAIEIGAKDLSTLSNEWFAVTPEGYFDGSANAPSFIRWRVGNHLYPAERYLRRFRRPDLVQKALRRETITESPFAASDVPPVLHFTTLKYETANRSSVTVTLETQSQRPVKASDLTLLVNGRPLPPEAMKPLPNNLTAPKALEIGAKAIEMGSKAIELGAKTLDPASRPVEIGAKPVRVQMAAAPSQLPLTRRFTFRVPLPLGASEVRLRSIAFDESGLGSNWTEMTPLRRPGQKPVAGNLYVLSIGVSRYRNANGRTFKNLKFAAADAGQMAQRLKREGTPLYQKVEIYGGGALSNEKATVTNIRSGLKWLQSKMRPGQIDTAIVFLSGHGVSDASGRFFFPAHEFDTKRVAGTSISGEELQRELGSKLRAKSVFLFVDSCHSGALAGARTTDLNFEIAASGVNMMASSGSTQLSYEYDGWKHGAFTLALLNSLAKRELARGEVIHFDMLTFSVPNEISRLLKAAGQNPNAQEPVVPLEGRMLNVAVAAPRASGH